MKISTPLAESPRIVITGLRNAGKSSIINNLLERDVSIVSATPGTTTDPVTRKMELGDLGDCAITDTAGLDESGDLGNSRKEKSLSRLNTSDIIVFVSRVDKPVEEAEKEILSDIIVSKKPFVFLLTCCDLEINSDKQNWASDYYPIEIDNINRVGITKFRKKLCSIKIEGGHEITPVEGLVDKGDLVILVTPIDSAAPKGRLILPQAATLRDLLDRGCSTLVVQVEELKETYYKLGIVPKLVITDSQAFKEVSEILPEDQPLTSFSLLYARKKGDLDILLDGLDNIHSIPEGGKVLVMESCSHHRKEEDIGTVKIPKLFKNRVNKSVDFDFVRSLPNIKKLKEYHLMIHCGACMTTGNIMRDRIKQVRDAGVHITNYGIFLGWVNGLIPRTLEPLKV